MPKLLQMSDICHIFVSRKEKNTMEQNNNIQKAIEMIEHHDWNWRMADYGYEWRYNSAKADMKSFVKLVKSIEVAEVRETLRNMWTLVFYSKMDEYRTRKAELLNAYAA